jgi:hypothetical protein
MKEIPTNAKNEIAKNGETTAKKIQGESPEIVALRAEIRQ